MCGRYSLAGSGQLEFRTRFGLSEGTEIRPRFNICPADDVPAIIAGEHGRELVMLRWGLVPHWSRDATAAHQMINARSETVFEKAAFRGPVAESRCLVLADGFYEWEQREGGKQPWHVTLPGGEPFAFAGIWTTWRSPEHALILRTCSLLTRSAQPNLASIHPRQPVILGGPEEEALWIDRETPIEVIEALAGALPPTALVARAVGPAVSNVRNDGPECLQDAAPDPQQALW